MLSIIIPSRNEVFLNKTIEDLLAKAKGDIEIIAILDGYWPDPVVQDPRVSYLHRGESRGMRNGITSAAKVAKGEYLMKIDAHCLVDEGFDLKLIADYQPNWVLIPRRKRLDAINWCIKDVGKPDVDYEYLCYPDNPGDFGGIGINGRIWTERIIERADIMVDDTPASQGSCWFMAKDYFFELELMDEESYGAFQGESQELAFKSVLSGGRYMVTKNTWYAHLHKGKEFGRGYSLDHSILTTGKEHTMKYFEGKKVWHKQIRPFSYFFELYPDMPGWSAEEIQKLKEREAQNYHD